MLGMPDLILREFGQYFGKREVYIFYNHKSGLRRLGYFPKDCLLGISIVNFWHLCRLQLCNFGLENKRSVKSN